MTYRGESIRPSRLLMLAAVATFSLAPARSALTQEVLFCGRTVSRHLAAGATDQYRLAASQEKPVVVDVIDTDDPMGLLRLHFPSYGNSETCDGSALIPAGDVDVSDCIGSDATDYAIGFNIVEQGPENCGVPLSCGVAPEQAELSALGEVDPYTFSAVAGQQISLTASLPSETGEKMRLRLFTPAGDPLADSCAGTISMDVPSTGTYTVLASACTSPFVGPYSIVWQTLPACPQAAAGGVAYVLFAQSGTVAVIDLATNQVVAVLPGPIGPDSEATFGHIVTTPNQGFAYAAFTSAIVSIINTSTNRIVGSISLPTGEAGPFITFSPDGTSAYAYNGILQGVITINTATHRIDALVPLARGAENAPLAVSPDGKLLYIPTLAGHPPELPTPLPNGLSVIDTTIGAVVGHLDVPDASASPLAISVDPAGATVYVTYFDNMYVIDAATREVLDSMTLPSVSDIVFARDGHTAYAGSGQLVYKIDVPTLTITGSVPLDSSGSFATAGAVALSNDGLRLLVTNADAEDSRDSTAVAVVDTQTFQVVASIPSVGNAAVSIATASPPSGLCTGDDQGLTRVTIGELVTSVNYSVDGCPNLLPPQQQSKGSSAK